MHCVRFYNHRIINSGGGGVSGPRIFCFTFHEDEQKKWRVFTFLLSLSFWTMILSAQIGEMCAMSELAWLAAEETPSDFSVGESENELRADKLLPANIKLQLIRLFIAEVGCAHTPFDWCVYCMYISADRANLSMWKRSSSKIS